MPLEPLDPSTAPQAAKILAEYWQSRGLPQYGLEWAKKYVQQGHGTDILEDAFYTITKRFKCLDSKVL